jgi:hypothetical protein
MTKFEQVLRYVIDLERRLGCDSTQSYYRLKGYMDCLVEHKVEQIDYDRRALRRILP